MSLMHFALKIYSKSSVKYMLNKSWTYAHFVQLVSNTSISLTSVQYLSNKCRNVQVLDKGRIQKH